MNLMVIRKLSEKYEGGVKKLSQDIGMSEANLHRCINLNKMQAGDLERVAIALDVDVRIFFDSKAIKNDSLIETTKDDSTLISLCKALVSNYQQREDVMSQLVSIIKER